MGDPWRHIRGTVRWMQPCSAAWDCMPGNAWLSTFIVVAI